MVYPLLQIEQEQPKDTLSIKRIKFHLSKLDLLAFLVILLTLANIVSILFIRIENNFLVSLNGSVILFYFWKNGEEYGEKKKEVYQEPSEADEPAAKVVNLPLQPHSLD